MKIGKRDTELFLFSDMIAHIGLSQVSIAKLVQLIREFLSHRDTQHGKYDS